MRRLLPLLCCLPLLQAEEPLPGHSDHGQAFNEGPRQAAVLLEGCGKVDFPVTTGSGEARKFFNQGVAQFHGFWFYEAERSFRQALKLDPGMAMGYWGCSLANVNNEKRAAEFIAEAVKRRDSASVREKLWIAAWQKFYGDLKKDKKQRYMDLIKDLEGIVHEHPEDVEAKALLAWTIWKSKDGGVAMVSRESVDALLREVLAKEPMHPAHHYRIHLWDEGKPARGLESAAACGPSAPTIAHMWHMPGHIYGKLGRHEDAAWHQEASSRVDHGHIARTGIRPDQIHNYAHNQEWLVRTLREQGRAGEALAIARNMVEVPRHPKSNSLENPKHVASHGRTRLLETLLKFEKWDEVIALEGSRWLDPTDIALHEIVRVRSMGVAAFFLEDRTRLESSLAELEKLRKKIGDKEPGVDEQGKKLPDARQWVKQGIAELAALVAMNKDAGGKEIAKLLDEAKDTPAERLVRYHLKRGDKEKAVEVAGKLPQDAMGLAVRVDVLATAGKTDGAKKHFETLRKRSAAMDRDLAISARMDALVVELGFPKEWRLAPEVRKDVGERPEMAKMGPLLWEPAASKDFHLADVEGQMRGLSTLRGKPVVVVFYLGSDCVHCMEQLTDFAKRAEEFAKRGIEMVAIGSEEPMGLRKTADKSKSGGMLLLADPDLKVFKDWGCHDDFEEKPLHGTFLIDGSGQMRWMEVSYDPFQDATFLLKEADRLLQF
ncbi:MAG: redoxin domain-containing protein [Akkermansiaceae bacterium]|nr:redoxin domain-containing protein [Akkermansiaceae bacterium]